MSDLNNHRNLHMHGCCLVWDTSYAELHHGGKRATILPLSAPVQKACHCMESLPLIGRMDLLRLVFKQQEADNEKACIGHRNYYGSVSMGKHT